MTDHQMSENKRKENRLTKILPIIAVESSPVLPGLMASLHVPAGKSTAAIEHAMKQNRTIGLLLPKRDLHTPPANSNLLTPNENVASQDSTEEADNAANQDGIIEENLENNLEADIEVDLEAAIELEEALNQGPQKRSRPLHKEPNPNNQSLSSVLAEAVAEASASALGKVVNYRMEDLYDRGVVVRILKKIILPDESMNLLMQGLARFEVLEPVQKSPYLCASVRYFHPAEKVSQEIEALKRTVIQDVKRLSESNPYFTEEMKIAMINAPTPGALADMVAFALALRGEDAQGYIETIDVRERFLQLLVFLRKEKDMADIQSKLSEEVNTRVEKFQREFFLREQLKTIRRELGMEEDEKTRDANSLLTRITEAKLPNHAQEVADEEMRRLKMIPEHSPEYHVARSYLEWIADLPWSKLTPDNLDLKHARKMLEKSHFGLDDVKDRILEFLAVRNLKPDTAGTILCFVGPPGVGKTSLGKAIAEALGRKFFRSSLGGMRDEAEIKGHRRTYVGAMPGKILQGLKRAEASNALIMLDEIDKVGSSYQGDPASALLEVLDPEQNNAFLDNYLDIPFDLSGVMFIATANTLSTIPPALLDRMEVIEISGYTQEEKEKIARQHVIPRSLEKHGLQKNAVKLPVKSLRKLLSDYAREPGVRTLHQHVDKISRRVARLKVEKSRKAAKPITIEEKDMAKWLGPKRFYNEMAERAEQPGVMTGLAWTQLGGEILFIEAIALPGSGDLKLTGQMGEVMEESARIALSHVKKYVTLNLKLKLAVSDPAIPNPSGANSAKKIDATEWFRTHDIHLHIPSGAVPKDGPSAGVTMASALLSLITGKLAKQKLAMTGELSLVGKVLPIGGVRDKLLAAKRAGIKRVLLPKLNEKDLAEIPKQQLRGLDLHFVSRVEEVFFEAIRDLSL